jgi:hypothetical protein
MQHQRRHSYARQRRLGVDGRAELHESCHRFRTARQAVSTTPPSLHVRVVADPRILRAQAPRRDERTSHLLALLERVATQLWERCPEVGDDQRVHALRMRRREHQRVVASQQAERRGAFRTRGVEHRQRVVECVLDASGGVDGREGIRRAVATDIERDDPSNPAERFHELSELGQIPHEINGKARVVDDDVDRTAPEHRESDARTVTNGILDIDVPHAGSLTRIVANRTPTLTLEPLGVPARVGVVPPRP